ncbi:hypothetical protein TrLO_g13330 [Triparma laevis f. longispina]|uniref:Uncharacterized protein n=1 Tax=Triparma laevis f. longispina TaxID=1714387 RepID=A0A9W7L0I4_9STRA|nr:hypothetical protein TrLO_g13330 [Triparma laevis f. longispina]
MSSSSAAPPTSTSPLPTPPPSSNLKEMILEKESELQTLTSYRLTSLQSMLSQKTSQMSAITQKFNKLKEDFEYNVTVIGGRDRELSRYEIYVKQVEEKLRESVEEIRRGEDEKEEEKGRWKKEIDSIKDEVKFWKGKFDDSIRDTDDRGFRFERERENLTREIEEVRRESQRQSREREEDMESQRREVTNTFDEVLRVREMEGRRREEELRTNIREVEGRYAEAMGQVEAARGREADLRAGADRDRAAAEESERALRQTKWSCEDQIRVKDGRVMELSSECSELKKANTLMAEEYEKKMSDLLGSLHEVEKAFVEQRAKHEEQAAKQQHAKDEQIRLQREKLESVNDALTNKLSQAESRVETLEDQINDDRADFDKRLKESQSKMRQDAAEHLAKVQKAEEEARDAKGRAWTSQTELSNEQGKTTELTKTVRELTVRVEELRTELSKADSGVEEARRLSKDRLTAMQREHERMLEKLEDGNAEHVRDANGQRDRAISEKRTLESKIEELEDEVTRLRTDLHGAKLRMRFTETTAPVSNANNTTEEHIDTNAGVFTALAQPSPMFSDDMGPATPLVLDSMGDSTVGFSNNNNNGNLEAENKKLREMVGVMRHEMEDLTKQLLSSPDNNLNSGPAAASAIMGNPNNTSSTTAAAALEQQLVHAREYVVLLQSSANQPDSELSLLRRHVQELSVTIDQLRSENDRLNRSSKSLRSQVVELERQLSVVDEGFKMGENPSQATIAAEKKVRDLESKLSETHSELKSISSDRNRLLDLSNKLRMDMLKASPKKDDFTHSNNNEYAEETNNPASQQLAEHLRRTESKIAAKYEAKIHDIEDNLRTLSQHNSQVRSQIDRWGAPTVEGMHLVGSSPSRSTGLAWQDEDKNLLEARRGLLKAKEEVAGIGGSWGEYGSGVPLSTTLGGIGGGDALGSAYTRPPMLRSGAGHISGTMTDSQRDVKERLARSQRRRVELLGERRKVRNYNFKDSDED